VTKEVRFKPTLKVATVAETTEATIHKVLNEFV